MDECKHHDACESFYDISSILDGVDEEIYINAVHLGPQGNRIVAEEIYSIIQSGMIFLLYSSNFLRHMFPVTCIVLSALLFAGCFALFVAKYEQFDKLLTSAIIVFFTSAGLRANYSTRSSSL